MAAAWIAEHEVVFVSADGHRSHGRIAVGLPESTATACRCLTMLDGLDARPKTIWGESTLQALLLAMRFLAMRLHDYVSKGGRVLEPADDTDVSLKVVLGPLYGPPD